MKVDSNKLICLDFVRNFLNGFIYNHYELSLDDQAMNLPPLHLQEMPCLRLVLIHL